MMNNQLEIKTRLQIQKSLIEVFEAVVDPFHMINYFISESSGKMEQGKTIWWKFPEFNETVPVKIEKIEPGKLVSFSWLNNNQRYLVIISFLEKNHGSTLVTVTETGGENNDSGITWLKQNTEGWANFLACLKAYLEYGINLRKGAFDFMKDEQ
jgi:uncharacterized protein YndB with AHSA1/START domain